jgi:hypothetical protein
MLSIEEQGTAAFAEVEIDNARTTNTKIWRSVYLKQCSYLNCHYPKMPWMQGFPYVIFKGGPSV